MPGFGALGQYPVAGGPYETKNFSGGDWQRPALKKGLTVAVITAATFNFVPPPPARAAPVFSSFSQPLPRITREHEQPKGLFVSAPRRQTAVFSTFSQPRQPQQPSAHEQASDWNFQGAPATIAFSGFSDFAAQHPIVLKAQQVTAEFVFVEPTVPPGGTSRRINFKTGFEPIKKVYPKRKPLLDDRLPIPPTPPPPAPEALRIEQPKPVEIVDPASLGPVVSLEQQAMSALDEADVRAFLRTMDQDEQDAADIAAILAQLEEDDD